MASALLLLKVQLPLVLCGRRVRHVVVSRDGGGDKVRRRAYDSRAVRKEGGGGGGRRRKNGEVMWKEEEVCMEKNRRGN